jgi:outer membrane protein assembly factor BamB
VGLSAVALDGSFRWEQSLRVDTLPEIAGSVIVVSGAGFVNALDARTGRKLWTLEVGERALLGAGDDGTTTVVTLAHTRGERDLFVAVRHDGALIQRLESTERLGAPAVQGGVAFLPWDQHYVSALALDSARELARISLEPVVSRAVSIAGHLYFGHETLLLFDERIAKAPASLSVPTRPLPGNPRWLRDGYEIFRPGNDTMRPAVYALPELQAGTLRTANEAYAAGYVRTAFGISAKTGELRWVRTQGSNLLAGAPAQGGFVFCSSSGSVDLVDARSGGQARNLSLGAALRACVVQADTFQVPAGRPVPPLTEQLSRALNWPDVELGSVQLFLIDELVKSREPIVTKILIDVAGNARTPPEVRQHASMRLAQQRTGAEYMLEALENHYDFLSEVLRPPPVGPLAEALAAMGEKRAAPLLVEHLNDPATLPQDVEAAARALKVLATPAQAEELRTFFALYRATAEQPALVQAVIHTAEALLRIGGEEGRDVVERASRDPLTRPTIRDALTRIVTTGQKQSIGTSSQPHPAQANLI